MGVSHSAMNRLGKGPHANMGASMDHSREAHKAITLYINQEVDLWKKYTSGFRDLLIYLPNIHGDSAVHQALLVLWIE